MVVDADFATVGLGAPKNEVMEALCVVFVLFTTPGPLEEERASAALRLSEEAMENMTRRCGSDVVYCLCSDEAVDRGRVRQLTIVSEQ